MQVVLPTTQFTCIVAAAVYVLLDANAKVAMKELWAAISKVQTLHLIGHLTIEGAVFGCTGHHKLSD